jgi:hypothetical protein
MIAVARPQYTRDRGSFRILVTHGEEHLSQNQYFEVFYYARGETRSEIVYVRSARIAYNAAVRAHGSNLLNVYNLETGEMVVGGR